MIVGGGRVGSELAARLTREQWHGLQPVGFLDEPSGADGILPTLGTPAALDQAVAATGAECVVIAFTTLADEQLLPLLEQCGRLRLRTLVVPRPITTSGTGHCSTIVRYSNAPSAGGENGAGARWRGRAGSTSADATSSNRSRWCTASAGRPSTTDV